MKHLIAFLCLALATLSVWADDPSIGETSEILYTQANAPDLYAQAQQLSTPLNIYQYLRNNTEYALYHGSISGSVNTYGAMRGNDVDLAATLIAMLRARGTPARYVVGTISVSAAPFMNWLGVQNLALGASLLNDQGIQNVTVSADNSAVSFEHVWVEALVYYDSYRGGNSSSVDCVATPTVCHWVPLDPSFKQRTYGNQNIDLHDTVQFDYNSYYDAILNNDTSRMNKNPLEIFEEQTTSWLNANMPGTTLEDVANTGVIQADTATLLPASLPYTVVGTLRRYDSARDHDAQVPTIEAKKWIKTLWLTLTHYDYAAGKGYTVTLPAINLVDITTQRLTVAYNSSQQQLEVTLGGGAFQYIIPSANSQLGTNVTPDTLYDLSINMDGPPSTVSGTADQPLTALYQNMKFGGYYEITTGGETSNWSQVHRAAQQLLTSNAQYKIVFNPSDPGLNGQACDPLTRLNCTPYLDVNNNGWDASDPTLASQPVAMEALTGGLLYVAGMQYFVQQREALARLDHLNHTKTPISGFMGVVSSVGTPEYIANTAFSILPGGLLIDMKGDYFAGSWRIGQPVTTASSNKVFELAGHVSSSLEHETWQQLTGYDAVSTVRGIQMARASGATLLNPKKTSTQNTLPTFYSALGFTSAVPSGFTYAPMTVFSTQPAMWTASADPASFDLLKSDVNYSTSTLRRYQTTYTYASNFGLYPWVSCVGSQQSSLNSLIASGYGNTSITSFTNNGAPLAFCDGSQHTGTVNSVLSQLQTFYQNTVIPTAIGEPYFDIFDRAQGFATTDYLYRASPAALNAIDTATAQVVRDSVSIPLDAQGQPNGHHPEFLIPSQLVVGSTYRFSVYIWNDYDASGNLGNNGYYIYNNSTIAGGGYVDGKKPLNPATAVSGSSTISPTFYNATLTNKNTIAETNNHPLKTPLSSDPVSTVTGNNIHDETDFVIKGRAGLNYVFTRSYNSAPSSTQVDIGLGFGWVHSYGMRLTSNDYGNCPNCTAAQDSVNGNGKTSSITYTDERGGDHNYLVNESTFAVTAPQGEYDSLAVDSPTTGQHTLTFRNGTQYIFETPSGTLKTTPNVTARLKKIVDPWGNQLNFTYNAAGRLATVTDNLGISGRTGLVFSYDTSNHLTQITDWSGRLWKYGVVNDGGSPAAYHLHSYTNPLSQTLTYGYASGTNNLTSVAKPLRGANTTFTYYQNGRTFNDYDALSDTETLDYDLYRKSTRITDPRGGIREYEYDSAGRLTKLTEADGAILQFSNQSEGLRYKKTDGLGYATQYSYRSDKSFNTASDTFGNVTREQDVLNNTIDTTYGPYDQVASMKDKRGVTRTTSFHSTTDGTCKTTGKPDTVTLSALTVNGSTLTNVPVFAYCWNSDGTLSSTKEYITPGSTARYRQRTYNYDTAAHLNVSSIVETGTDGTTVTHSFGYDSLGRKTSETLSRRNTPTDATLIPLTTTFTPDALDRTTLVQDAVGNQMETVYDANGQIYQLIGHYKQPDSSYVLRTLSTRTYDAADRLIADKDVYNNSMQYQYDPAGNRIAVIDPYQHTTKYEYDAMNRRSAVTDANGNRATTTHDLAGHIKTVTNANGETVTNTYDALGRLTQVTDPLGYITQYSYDANGNLTCRIDANAQAGQPKNSDNCTESRVYDELNRVIQSKDALNGLTVKSYDLLSNVTSIKDATNKTTSFAFDDLGRQISTTDPLTKTTSFARDQAGNVYQVTNRLGQITRITFDTLNRPTNYSYLTDGTSETISYDSFGNKSGASNATVSYTFQYDAKNRLQSKTDSRSNKTLSFTYDAVDNMLSKTDYQGQTTDFQYDGANRLVSMSNKAYVKAMYQFDPAGRLLSRVLSDGAKSVYGYNADGQLTSLLMQSASGTIMTSLTYTRDRVGNALTQNGQQAPSSTDNRTYTYDALYRLTQVSSSAGANEAFTYDAVGNRQTYNDGSTHAYEYFANSNRLKATHTNTVSGAIEKSFTYDDEGRRLTQSGGSNYASSISWDQKNRAISMTSSGNGATTFQYDPMDYRIKRSGGSLGARDYYLEGEHLEAEYSNGVIQSKYLRGISTDELVAGFTYSNGQGTPGIYHHDQLTSVTAVSNHDGSTQQALTYGAFGNLKTITGSTTNRLRYTGRELDPDTNLYYYRARYYDPAIGNFLSPDPLGFAAGINEVAYVNNNPINGNDPSGNMAAMLEGFDAARAALIAAESAANARNAIVAGKMATGFAMGYEGAQLTGTESEAGKVGAGLFAAGGLGFSGPLLKGTMGLTGLNAYFATALNSGLVGGSAEFAAELGDYGANGTSMSASKIGKVSALTGGISLFGGEAALSGLTEGGGLSGADSALLDTLGNVLTTMPALGAQKTLFPQTPTINTSGQDYFDYNMPSSGAAAGGFVIYPNKPNNNTMQQVYRK